MGAPTFLRSFADDTRLPVRFNFDIGHANLADGAEEDRIETGFKPLRDLVAGVHVHDNHGEKDEHLPPYDGSIDWAAAIKTLKSGPEKDLPLVLELKEKIGPDAPSDSGTAGSRAQVS
jgi:sugar phosphate isomerase/epimerase